MTSVGGARLRPGTRSTAGRARNTGVHEILVVRSSIRTHRARGHGCHQITEIYAVLSLPPMAPNPMNQRASCDDYFENTGPNPSRLPPRWGESVFPAAGPLSPYPLVLNTGRNRYGANRSGGRKYRFNPSGWQLICASLTISEYEKRLPPKTSSHGLC